MVDSGAPLARSGVDEATTFCRSGAGLSRRSRAFARKRLVLTWTGRKFAEAKEKRRRSCSNPGEVQKSLGKSRSDYHHFVSLPAAGVNSCGQKPGSVELTFSQTERKPTALRKRPLADASMVSVNGSR